MAESESSAKFARHLREALTRVCLKAQKKKGVVEKELAAVIQDISVATVQSWQKERKKQRPPDAQRVRTIVRYCVEHGHIDYDLARDLCVSAGHAHVCRDVQTLFPHIGLASHRPEAWGLPPIHNITYNHNRHFVGREALLQALHKLLHAERRAALTQTALYGLGGIGKTQLAVEYVYTWYVEYDIAWWIRAEEPATLEPDYAALATKLAAHRLLTLTSQEIPSLIADAQGYLEGRGRWLLVFDNAEEPERLRPYLPRTSNGQVLITSRYHDWGSIAHPFLVPELARKDAQALLLKRAGLYHLGEPETVAAPEAAIAEEIAEILGDLPFLLEQVGAFLGYTRTPLAEYRDALAASPDAVLDADMRPSSTYPPTLRVVWDRALHELERSSPDGVCLLRLCAFLAPDDIPLDLARQAGPWLPEPLAEAGQSSGRLHEAVASLLRYSLIKREGNVLLVHRMVQAVTRDRLAPAERETWVAAVVRLINESLLRLKTAREPEWPMMIRLLPHALAALDHAQALRVPVALADDHRRQEADLLLAAADVGEC